MALTSAGLKSRMDREFKLLGLSSSKSNEKNDILTDAVSEFVSLMDTPILSANLTIVADTTRYTKPATIEKIVDIRDTDFNSVVYSEDETRGEFVLQDTPVLDATWIIYGTPADIETNIDVIVAAIDTDYKAVLWAFIRYAAYAWAPRDSAPAMYKLAREIGLKKRGSINRRLDWGRTTVKTLDTTGANIADPNNSEGFKVQKPDLFKSDL